MREYMRERRDKAGAGNLSIVLEPGPAEALVYLKKAWRIRHSSQCVSAALLYLKKQTRAGLLEF
jgi:hypothetical protein